VVAEVIDSLQASLVPSDIDRKRLELIRRQKSILQDLQRQLLNIRKTWKQNAYSSVLNLTEPAVQQIGKLTKGDDLEPLFQTAMKQAVAEIDGLHDSVTVEIEATLDHAHRKLDEIGDSRLALEFNADSERAAYVGVSFKGKRPDGSEIAAKLGKAAAKPLQEGLGLASRNANEIRNLVYSAGKVLGKKFRPWEAVKSGQKLAKVAGKAGKALPALTFALDLYLQYREEKIKEEKAIYLANLRQALRNAFADQAKVEAENLEAAIVKVSQGPVASALAALDADAAALADAHSGKEALAREISSVLERCTRLRNCMFGGVEHVFSEA